ncbi:MAG: APC family permease [Candidatus Methylomirabilis oxyfera]|nr:APC family permease [Candidatus Methylomirabilis oxyfera]
MAVSTLKRKLLGTPLRTAEAPHQRLSNFAALAVFSSDNLSSVAYATEEILLVLVLAGSAGLSSAWPISIAIALLLVIVATSYRQTIHAYPSGGGAYIVAKENLGVYPGLIAAAALLIDYVLTVAVSIAAGVAAITSALPALYPYRVSLGILCIGLITLANLRGVRESGRIFAGPTYFFIAAFVVMIGFGLFKSLVSGAGTTGGEELPAPGTGLSLFLLLRAFASGCAALTGVEAISNGIQAFKHPESKNAATTLTWMAGILLTLFLGITALSGMYGVLPREGETLVSQIARRIFGTGSFYYLIQGATAMILILAANTSFADFPRLSSILARDRFMPHQLANQGDRLVYSNGIVGLGLLASALIWLFHGETHALIPLYAVGVFLSFTLSQAGMVRHWLMLRRPGWPLHVAINGLGAISTGVVLAVIAAVKLIHGAWIVIALIPLMTIAFVKVHEHYRSMAEQLTLQGFEPQKPKEQIILVPVSGIHRGVVTALQYARSLSPHVEAIYVDLDVEATEALRVKWGLWAGGTDLVILDSPYRSILGPLIEYLDGVERKHPDAQITVVLPQVVPARWWHNLLHNQTAWFIKGALLFRKRIIVVTDVPLHLTK